MDIQSLRTSELPIFRERMSIIYDRWKGLRATWTMYPLNEIEGEVKEAMQSMGYSFVEEHGGFSHKLEIAIIVFSSEPKEKLNNHPVIVFIHYDTEFNVDYGCDGLWLRSNQVMQIE